MKELNKETILDFNYNSFIGTRFTCEQWEQPISEDLKECILLCMDEYAAQRCRVLQSENERLKGLIEQAHTRGWLDYPDPDQYDMMQTKDNTVESSWEQFKSENNL